MCIRDRLLVYYALNRKTTKWWKRLFFRLLDMAIINAMVLYLNVFPEKRKERQSHKKYRLQLAHELVQPLLDLYADPSSGRSSGRKPVTADVRLKGKHFAVSQQPRRRCVACAYQKTASGIYKNTKTVNFCEKCGKYICRECFETYHTRSNLDWITVYVTVAFFVIDDEGRERIDQVSRARNLSN